MQLPAKLSGLERKIEMLRSGVDLARVCGGRFDERTWRKHTRGVELVMPLLDLRLEPWQLEKKNWKAKQDAIRLAAPRVSRLLKGQRLISLPQVIALAHHFGLVGVVGSEHEAAALLCDDVTADDFERRLVQSGWRKAGFRHGAYMSRLQILDQFKGVSPLTRSGLDIVADVTDASSPEARPRRKRGANIPDALSGDDLVECALDSHVRFRLEAKKRVGLMLFEIRPSFGRGQRYEVACLAPSVMAPDVSVAPSRGGVLVPSPRPGDPRDHFVLTHPLGRHDVVAVLSDPPIEVPWITAHDSLYEPTAAELTSLLDGIVTTSQRRAQHVEIRHLPYRIVARARTSEGPW